MGRESGPPPDRCGMQGASRTDITASNKQRVQRKVFPGYLLVKILAVKREEVKPTFRLAFEEEGVVRIISGSFAGLHRTDQRDQRGGEQLEVLANIFDREAPSNSRSTRSPRSRHDDRSAVPL